MKPTTDIAKTSSQFDKHATECRNIFLEKTKEVNGTPWRVFRANSLTKQLYLRFERIRAYEEDENSDLHEAILNEYKEALNMTVKALIQLKAPSDLPMDLEVDEAMELYDKEVATIKELMMKKNHDYGEAWRDMRTTSFTDLILQKLIRISQIERNDGKTIISEGIDAGYQDIVNYSIFFMIRTEEARITMTV